MKMVDTAVVAMVGTGVMVEYTEATRGATSTMTAADASTATTDSAWPLTIHCLVMPVREETIRDRSSDSEGGDSR